MYVCICNAVTEREIRQAVALGVTTLKELREGLGVAATAASAEAARKTSCATNSTARLLRRRSRWRGAA